MRHKIGVTTYDFNKSYYENFLSTRLSNITAYGKLKNDFDKYFQEGTDTETSVSGNTITTSGTVDVKSYVQRTYNNDIHLCALDQAWQDFTGAIDKGWTDTRDYLGDKLSLNSIASGFKKPFNLW